MVSELNLFRNTDSAFRIVYYKLSPKEQRRVPIAQNYVDLLGVFVGIVKTIVDTEDDAPLKERLDQLFDELGVETLNNAIGALENLPNDEKFLFLVRKLALGNAKEKLLSRILGPSLGGALESALQNDVAIIALFVDEVLRGFMPVIAAWENSLKVLSDENLRQFAERVPLPVNMLQGLISFERAFGSVVIEQLPEELIAAAAKQVIILDTDKFVPDEASVYKYLSEDAENRVHLINDALVKKLKGAATALEVSEDGISQAANSLIELIDRMLRDFACHDEVVAWLADNGLYTKETIWIDSGCAKPTKLGESLHFLYGGGSLPSSNPAAEGAQVIETLYYYLAKSLCAARNNLQKVKHSDHGSVEERELITTSTAAIVGVVEIAHRFCWIYKGSLPSSYQPV